MSCRTKVWTESILAAGSALLFALTLVTREWIEIVFRVDPDRGSGAVEWIIAAGLLAVATASGWLARTEHRQRALARV
jgi:hypothetical protein